MRSQQVLDLLRRYESRNVTFLEADQGWPVVWNRARGMHVWDAEGKRYLDLTAAFGVAAAGHANPQVVRAGRRQMARLLHAMGDVHPHASKARLARELSALTFERWSRFQVHGRAHTGKTIFGNSGFEAVEAALKTALLATGKPGVVAFHGAYHGLGYGALSPTHREYFRAPFRSQLREFASFIPFPKVEADLAGVSKQLRQCLRAGKTGAVLVEPIQGRGGINIPPVGFLRLLRGICDEYRALLILDEVYTGFGRTGAWFACEHSRTAPDLICLGKALTGGFPLSACVGRADLMDAAWPPSSGEALHTSTFLGNPVGCEMALAQIAEIRSQKLVTRANRLGKVFATALSTLSDAPPGLTLLARNVGLMGGIELLMADGAPATRATFEIIKEMLRRGYILLPEGEHGNVIGLTPPLIITERQLTQTLEVLAEVIRESGAL